MTGPTGPLGNDWRESDTARSHNPVAYNQHAHDSDGYTSTGQDHEPQPVEETALVRASRGEDAPQPPPETLDPDPDTFTAEDTVEDLREAAKARGITIRGKNKADLLKDLNG